MTSRAVATCTVALLAAACASSSTAPPPTNGVDDVLAACKLRVPWTNATTTACSTCIGLATAPRCACSDTDYAGKCNEQQAGKTKEPTCDGVDACTGKCDRTDCACVDACYSGKPACRTKASAVDGCVAAVCDAHCR